MEKRYLSKVWYRVSVLVGICLVAPGLMGNLRASEISLPPLHVKVGEKAPDFALPGADGKVVRLSDFAGHIVLLDFYRGHW